MRNDRIERTLRVLALAGLAGVLGVCGVVFALHRSGHTGPLPWSWRYLVGAVTPLLGVIVAQAALIRLPPLSGKRDRYLAVMCVAAAILLLIIGASILPLYELPVMAAFLTVMTVVLAAYRAFDAGEWLISYVAVAAACLIVFVPDLIHAARVGTIPGERRMPHWGDAATFRYVFPDSEPFTSAGGRMRPNLDLDVAVDIPGRPLYRIKTNSQGLRNDHEIALAKAPGEARILNLGDSFSVGFGVDQDRFIGSIVEATLNQPESERHTTVLNAEVSDPAYGLLYLQRYGMAYAPDVVLYGYVDNDSHQSYLAFEGRQILSLDPGGEVHTHPIDAGESARRRFATQQRFAQYVYPTMSPARLELDRSVWQHQLGWLARMSKGLRDFIVAEPLLRGLAQRSDSAGRAGEITYPNSADPTNHTDGHLRLLGLSDWGMLYKHGQAMTEPFYTTLFRIFASMQKTAADRGAIFVLAYYPRREQVNPQDWQRFHSFWNLAPDDFDLDLEARRLQTFCAERGIPFIDTTPALRAATDQRLYMREDSHFAEAGQAVAARTITEFLDRHMANSAFATASSRRRQQD